MPVSSTLVGTPSASKNETVSRTPNAASAEWRNFPLGPNAATIPRLSQSWVMLHRVPPDIRILTPGLRDFSSNSTRRPRSAAWVAAISPAAPAPRTTASQSNAMPSVSR